MMVRDRGSDAAAGVFAVGFAGLFFAVLSGRWWPLWIGGPLMLGSLVATARRRRTGPDPDVVLGPSGPDRSQRPWRRRR
ncbi:hypothetical protein D7294_13940 [Streptomyces hoynatensis]|uniref:Uncharacterized protein n=1 Tax=Streptomyces hoynatensis TaxID=1141874 RepID=A0A3A9YZU2_9ACTN|nr:hypothetical protein D7294_13940 [Streptomyces hoynatensis]